MTKYMLLFFILLDSDIFSGKKYPELDPKHVKR